jgi:hypothetical protein
VLNPAGYCPPFIITDTGSEEDVQSVIEFATYEGMKHPSARPFWGVPKDLYQEHVSFNSRTGAKFLDPEDFLYEAFVSAETRMTNHEKANSPTTQQLRQAGLNSAREYFLSELNSIRAQKSITGVAAAFSFTPPESFGVKAKVERMAEAVEYMPTNASVAPVYPQDNKHTLATGYKPPLQAELLDPFAVAA